MTYVDDIFIVANVQIAQDTSLVQITKWNHILDALNWRWMHSFDPSFRCQPLFLSITEFLNGAYAIHKQTHIDKGRKKERKPIWRCYVINWSYLQFRGLRSPFRNCFKKGNFVTSTWRRKKKKGKRWRDLLCHRHRRPGSVCPRPKRPGHRWPHQILVWCWARSRHSRPNWNLKK